MKNPQGNRLWSRLCQKWLIKTLKRINHCWSQKSHSDQAMTARGVSTQPTPNKQNPSKNTHTFYTYHHPKSQRCTKNLTMTIGHNLVFSSASKSRTRIVLLRKGLLMLIQTLSQRAVSKDEPRLLNNWKSTSTLKVKKSWATLTATTLKQWWERIRNANKTKSTSSTIWPS